jgi:hypothetical protein
MQTYDVGTDVHVGPYASRPGGDGGTERELCTVIVVLTIDPAGERVRVWFEHVHPWITDFHWMGLHFRPRELGTVRSVTLRRVRALLVDLCRIRELQGDHERAIRMCPGKGTRVLRRIVHPVVLHDACTLWMGVAGLSSYRDVGEGCPRCSSTTCGFSCTPPKFQGRALVRGHHDRLVRFCWDCLFWFPEGVRA